MGRQTPDRAARAALTLGRWALWLRTRIQMRRLLRRRRRDRVSLAVSRGGRRPRCPGLQGRRPDCREPARPGAGTLPLCRGPGQLRPEARGTAQPVPCAQHGGAGAHHGALPLREPRLPGLPGTGSPGGAERLGQEAGTQGEQYLPASPRGLRGARGARGRPRPTGSEPPLAPGRVAWALCAAGSLAALSDSRMVAPRDLGV